MTQLAMTITRFVTVAWDWMDEGAPDTDPAPDRYAQFRFADREAPELSDLDITPNVSWVGNFNRSGMDG